MTKSFNLEALKQISPSELENHGLLTKSDFGERRENHGYCCAYCSSGTGKNRSGALNFDYKDGIWVHKCHVCGEGGDNIKFFQQVFNANFQEACKQASEMFHVPYLDGSAPFSSKKKEFVPPPIIENSKFTRRYKPPERTKPEELPLIQDDIKRAQENLRNLPIDDSGSHYRGLHTKTYEYFGCGYLKDWIHPALRLKGEGYPSRRLIVPTSDLEHYLARKLNIDCKPDGKHVKMHAGCRTEVFNAADLTQPTVLVVEGEIDCMSIFETLFRNPTWANYQPPEKFFDFKDRNLGVVATTFAAGWQSLIISKIDAGLIPWRKFIILLDANDAGRKNAEEFRAALAERNFPVAVRFIYDYLTDDEKKKYGLGVDANDLLRRDRKRLSSILNSVVYSARNEFGNIKNQTDLDFNQPVKKGFAIKGFDEVEAAADDELAYNYREDDEPEKFSVDDEPTPVADEKPAPVNVPVVTADELQNQIDSWQSFNGEIDSSFLPKIHAAANHLRGILQSGINSTNVAEQKTKHAIAICKFYDFYISLANAALVAIDDAKNHAVAEVKRYKATGNLTVEPSDDCKILAQFSIRDFKADVDKIRKEYQKYHKACQRAAKQAKAEAENQRKKQERAAQVDDNLSRLEELKKQPQSAERDAEIISLIRDTCEWKMNIHGDRVAVKATQANADLIFKYDPAIDGLFAFDEFQARDVFKKAPPWDKNVTEGTEWRDLDEAHLQRYLRATYTEFANKDLVYTNTVAYSYMRKFHKIKDFFNNLPAWDGVKRAETLFVKFLRADDSPYVREVTLNWLTAAVARIFHPGCDYQLAPIILGPQGIGKTTLINALGGAWYGSLTSSVDDPHAVDDIQPLWIVEIKEMVSLKKDVDANKRFIDAKADDRRAPYEKFSRKTPRHVVFIVTTNNPQCLVDRTGNRRYPVIKCNSKQGEYTEIPDGYIQQVWAEVFAHFNELFADGFNEKKLVLSKAAQKESNDHAEEHLRDDGIDGEISAFVDTKILPPVIWTLLTKEEKRDFIKNGRLVVVDACSEFNHRRRSRGGRVSAVQKDVDLITSCLSLAQNKHWLRIEPRRINEKSFDEYILYGSEYRQRICAVEIFNECFGADRRKSMPRIYESLNRLAGWHLGARIKNYPCYGDQKNVYYRDADNVPADDEPENKISEPTSPTSFSGTVIDPNDTPF